MPDKVKNYEIISPEGDPNVGKEVFSILGKIIADKVRLGLHDRWFRNYQLRRNQHWKAKSPQGVPLVSANLLYTHIQRTTNTMTDNDPTFNVAAVGKIEDEQKDQLTDLQWCTEHWWRDQEQQDVFESSCINGEQYGIAIEKIVFNPDIEYRLGEVEAIPVDPFHFGWYPVKMSSARDLQKSEALCHFYPVSVRYLRAKYRDKADLIKPDSEILKDLKDDERREVIGAGGSGKGSVMTSIANTVRELLNFVSGTGDDDSEEETLLCEMWVRDKSTISQEEKDESTGETIKTTAPRYTGEIRYILVCSGGVVLEDKDNPNINPNLSEDQAKDTFLYDKFPFTAANSVKDTSNAWGLCYDDETEILTKTRGFVKFVDLDPSDLVATRNNKSRFEWQLPTKHTIKPYQGKMYRFKSSSMDLCVTPNHRMIVGMLNGTTKVRVERVMLAQELADGLNHERKIPVTSIWEPGSPELGTVVFPKSAMKPSKDISLSGDDYCALLGAYLAEGNLHSNSGIEIAQRKTSKGYAAYNDLFRRIGVPYDGKRWRMYGKTLREHFKQFGHAAEKYIPIKIKALPERQLRILWDFYVLGDGNFKKNPNISGRGKRGSDNDVTHITTISRRLADDLVEIGQKLGWSVSTSVQPARKQMIQGKLSSCQPAYKLCCRYSDYMAVKSETTEYSGMIYCVTVPNGVVYVRRGGKPSWCGNSDYEQLEWLNMEVNKTLSQLVLEKDRSARKKLIVPKDCGVPVEHFTNFVGIIEPSSSMGGQGIRWLETPPATIDYEKTIALFKDMFFLVSGTFEMDQAQGSGRDVIAYKAIAALLERAATMMRGKIRSYSRLIRDRGRMYLSHVMNFYTEERWITFKDKDGKEASKPIIGSSMIMPAKLTVVSGSTLPISRIQQREEALALYEKQAIDQTELLDKLDWSNRNEVITRMAQGPLGMVLQKFMATGMPSQIMEYAKAVGQMDPKDVQKALEDGQLPPFVDFMKRVLAQIEGQQGQADPSQQADFAAKNEEVKKLAAEVEKVIAERDLLIEKSLTEKVDQQVKLAGVRFDDQTLQMQRAKLVADIEAEAAGRHMEGVKTGLDFVSKNNNSPGYNERGMKSNNKEE